MRTENERHLQHCSTTESIPPASGEWGFKPRSYSVLICILYQLCHCPTLPLYYLFPIKCSSQKRLIQFLQNLGRTDCLLLQYLWNNPGDIVFYGTVFFTLARLVTCEYVQGTMKCVHYTPMCTTPPKTQGSYSGVSED